MKMRTSSLASLALGGGAKKQKPSINIKKINKPQYSQSITITPDNTHTHTHRSACTAAGTASIQSRKSSKQIPITQQGGMMQLPIRSSAGSGLTAQHSRDEIRDDREKRGREEEEGDWEVMGGGREALGPSC